jgi:hypothetical protein
VETVELVDLEVGVFFLFEEDGDLLGGVADGGRIAEVDDVEAGVVFGRIETREVHRVTKGIIQQTSVFSPQSSGAAKEKRRNNNGNAMRKTAFIVAVVKQPPYMDFGALSTYPPERQAIRIQDIPSNIITKLNTVDFPGVHSFI